MPFIGRREDGTVYGCWTVRQWPEQEELPDDHPDVVTFLAPPAPIDQADLDLLAKRDKVLALCIAQVGGLTVQQMRDLYRQKWNHLP